MVLQAAPHGGTHAGLGLIGARPQFVFAHRGTDFLDAGAGKVGIRSAGLAPHDVAVVDHGGAVVVAAVVEFGDGKKIESLAAAHDVEIFAGLGCFLAFGEGEEEFLERVLRVDRGGQIHRASFRLGELHITDLVKRIAGHVAVGIAVEDGLVGGDGFFVFLLVLVSLAELELHGRRESGVRSRGEDRGIHFGRLVVAAAIHQRIGDGHLRIDGAVELARLRVILEQLLVGIKSALRVAERIVKFPEAELGS